MNRDNVFLSTFRVVMSLISFVNVILNLWVIAFGLSAVEVVETDNGEVEYVRVNRDLVNALNYFEIFFLLEIVLQFFTSFKDSEHFENVYTMRLIAREYILNGNFIFHVIAFLPWPIIIDISENEQSEELVRNLLLFKLLRIMRLL